MSKTKHTAGPWMIVNYGDGDSLVTHSDSESRICFMATPGSHGDPAKIEADARLIAACPTMYAYIAKKAQDGDADAARILAAL